ncbi:MAG: L-aspartate oxidase [Deltaproteobacteria bacterium]|nr:L-aspartate oxidase [Deltaproteobacteria bacterium]
MTRTCDALVIGSGLAALTYALEASRLGRRVVVVTKRVATEGSTNYAQGGIAAVLNTAKDSFEQHVEDTLTAGAGLCRRPVVEMVVRAAPAVIERLASVGVKFDMTANGHGGGETPPVEYDLGREGGHSSRRVVHAGDITGREIMRGLLEAVRTTPSILLLENHTAVDLLSTRKVEGMQAAPHHTQHTDDRCLGAYVLNEEAGRVETILANVTLVATGGASKVYLYTSNPDVASGDGIAMAWRLGAEVANMEFIQFHPTVLFHPQAKSFLISEALRGEGGLLQRQDGSSFMQNYHPLRELAPRDIVARAIDTELKRTGDDYVLLNMTHLDADFLHRRFPNIHAKCLSFGVDLTRQPIPVVPAAHYVCGGVRTDLDGESTIPGLFVAGEAACTGMHGANRLASNSLLEAAVFGHRAAHASERYQQGPTPAFANVPEWNPGNAVPSDELVVITQSWDEIRRFMWNYVGIVRSNRRLRRAARRIETLKAEIREFYWNATVTRDLVELRNLCTVAELIVKSAMARKESRGLHYTIDFPTAASNEAPADTILKREDLV